MEDFVTWLTQECDAIRTDFLAHGLKKVGDDAFDAPLIVDLNNRAKSYLQSAKLCIRDCGLIFGTLVGAKFDHKFHKVVNWAEENFGKDDEFAQWLGTQHTWVKQILDMRNALEHPTDAPRGRLHIRNVDFQFSTKGVSGEAHSGS